MDFNCTGDLCSVAHSAADGGGEFVATYQLNIGFEAPQSWIVPTQDLVSIYKIRGDVVNASAIDECHLLFFAGEWAVKTLGWVIFQMETEKAPFLVEHYLDLPLGGVDDMSVWTARMWNRFASWIEVRQLAVFSCV
jgi:hypothetical protein